MSMGIFDKLFGGHHGAGHHGYHHGNGHRDSHDRYPTGNNAGMSCPNCRSLNAATARFCQQCGSSLVPAACPQCGTSVQAGAKFCGQCGNTIT
ncbi:double zinc ribbon domain-containing protein [Dickeya dadantii]|uniref:double zinc ribbon domain-containing protein n=2 Tax=Pectobacteriaceae TaxID=1903410 RepID=UPI0034576C17